MQNRLKLEKLGLKDIYYYYVFQKGNRGVFCLLVDRENNTLEARGLSVCSLKDQFIKRVGRAKAMGRALQAITHKKNVKHGFYQPVPVEYEKGILKKREKVPV
jgi:hypothetical protein